MIVIAAHLGQVPAQSDQRQGAPVQAFAERDLHAPEAETTGAGCRYLDPQA